MQTPSAFRRKLLIAAPAAATLALAGCIGIPGFGDVNMLQQEGEELYRAKRYDEAIAKFRAIVVRDPLNWYAWLWLARAFIVRGLWGDAIDSGRRAFQLSPQGADVLPVFLQALFGSEHDAYSKGRKHREADISYYDLSQDLDVKDLVLHTIVAHLQVSFVCVPSAHQLGMYETVV